MKYLVILLVLCCTSISHAQTFDGVWQGKLTQEPGGCFPEYYIELQIKSDNNGITGVSYDYFDTSMYVQLNFKGSFQSDRNKISIIEQKVLKEHIPDDCTPCLKTYDLSYSKQNNVEVLQGKWVGEDMGTILGCPPGFISLKKVKTSAFAIQLRMNEVVKKYLLPDPNVKVDFYDNGTIDGDSISVFLNNQVLISRQGLSLKPVTLQMVLQPSLEYDLVIFSESMGTISPTTALMVITSGTARYEIFISSDQSKNATVKLIYNKPG